MPMTPARQHATEQYFIASHALIGRLRLVSAPCALAFLRTVAQRYPDDALGRAAARTLDIAGRRADAPPPPCDVGAAS